MTDIRDKDIIKIYEFCKTNDPFVLSSVNQSMQIEIKSIAQEIAQNMQPNYSPLFIIFHNFYMNFEPTIEKYVDYIDNYIVYKINQTCKLHIFRYNYSSSFCNKSNRDIGSFIFENVKKLPRFLTLFTQYTNRSYQTYKKDTYRISKNNNAFSLARNIRTHTGGYVQIQNINELFYEVPSKTNKYGEFFYFDQHIMYMIWTTINHEEEKRDVEWSLKKIYTKYEDVLNKSSDYDIFVEYLIGIFNKYPELNIYSELITKECSPFFSNQDTIGNFKQYILENKLSPSLEKSVKIVSAIFILHQTKYIYHDIAVYLEDDELIKCIQHIISTEEFITLKLLHDTKAKTIGEFKCLEIPMDVQPIFRHPSANFNEDTIKTPPKYKPEEKKQKKKRSISFAKKLEHIKIIEKITY